MEVHDIVQDAGIKTIPKEKKCKKTKRLSEEALQLAVNIKQLKGKGEKEIYTHLNAEFQKIAIVFLLFKAFLAINAKK